MTITRVKQSLYLIKGNYKDHLISAVGQSFSEAITNIFIRIKKIQNENY